MGKIHDAVICGRLGELHLALEEDCLAVNSFDDVLQEPPLHMAMRKCIKDIVQYLLSNNANIYLRSDFGNVCLHVLLHKVNKLDDKRFISNYLECFELILRHEISLRMMNETGYRLLIATLNKASTSPLQEIHRLKNESVKKVFLEVLLKLQKEYPEIYTMEIVPKEKKEPNKENSFFAEPISWFANKYQWWTSPAVDASSTELQSLLKNEEKIDFSEKLKND